MDDSDIEEHIDEMDNAPQAPVTTDVQLQSPKPKRRKRAKTLHPAESEAKVHKGMW
jgi:ACT domain-containing protein